MELNITDNPDRKRFEAVVGDQTAFIEYIKTREKIYLTHTEVPQELSGKGIGKALVKGVLEEVKRLELELVPLCPFVALYIKRNPEWKALVMRGINID
ncbi:hypothetical protein SAMN04490243_2040 [Robiginitalea myxolifaciens]|uniref:N-acetyltransferase domain-containing protein n=1 Tax=Robiginitalea myxolifaciens TaxID=400055 RepID=A0A1I6H146_9FLAO|nr:GNAT family N-acetyltransferase [Robiginitalea myxolifaciens]SFR48175.1 hypothetical protein SAMN04490243_2040 [Robiginitalea myxolifaciens]